MNLIKWDESFSVGDQIMDTHHLVFFDIVKQFSALPGNDYAAVGQRINFLVEYTMMHLTAEERLMTQAGYPETEAHKAIHCAFSQKVLAIRDSYAVHPGCIPAHDILELMQDWFMNHILQEDMRYKPYIQNLQVSRSIRNASASM
jgi:hemerythrin